MAAICAWQVVFHQDVTIGVGAAFEVMVDDTANPKAIMWKIKNLLRRLPSWQIGKFFDKQMICQNPITNSVIAGECGPQIGRGGRSSIYFIDEFAHVEQSHSVFNSVSGNTDVIIVLSTPCGVGNKYEELRRSESWNQFVIDWTDDPRKVGDWEAKKRAEIGDVTFEQEYGRNAAASLENIVIPGTWVLAAVNYDVPEEGPLLAGLDIGTGNTPSTVLTVRRGAKVKGQLVFGKDATDPLDAQRAIPLIVGRVLTKIAEERNSKGEGIKCLAYDAAGDTGAAAAKEINQRSLPYAVIPFLGQKDPRPIMRPDGKMHREVYKNLRSEAWWLARERFRKTYENVYEGADHPKTECISIPNDRTLIDQLSWPLHDKTEVGLIQVWSKMKMKAKGIRSPDRADSLVYAFMAEVPTRRPESRFTGYSSRTA